MAEQDDSEDTGGGGKKKLILIIVGALLLVAISVGATLMLLGGDDADEELAQETAEPVKGDPVYIELKPFTVNLDPRDPVGFLQVDIHILTYFSDVAEDLEKHKPLLRNNLTSLFGRQQSADLRSAEGKTALQQQVREEIQQVVNKYGSAGKVEDVFFYNFVMQ